MGNGPDRVHVQNFCLLSHVPPQSTGAECNLSLLSLVYRLVAVLNRLVVHASATALATTPAADRAALIDLYVATNGDHWYDSTGWKDYAIGSDPCDDDWLGVQCSGASGSSDRDVM